MDSSQFTPPVRRALSDDEIAAFVAKSHADEAGMLEAMKLIEDQVALRQAEELEFEIWAVKMVQIGSPESLAALAKARGEEIAPAVSEAPNEPEVSTEPALPAESEAPAAAVKPEYVSDEDIIAALNEAYSTPIAPTTPAAPVTPSESSIIAEESVSVEPIQPAESAEPTAGLLPVVTPSGDALDDFELMLTNGSVEDEATAEEEHAVATPVAFTPSAKAGQESAPAVQSNSAFGQFWVWLALGSSLAPVSFAWLVAMAGASFLTSLLVGIGTIALGAFVVATGALAGKRSGLSTLVVSRAAFGVHGNFIPASFVLIAKFLVAVAGLLLAISALSLGVNASGGAIPATNVRIFEFGSAALPGLNWGLVYAAALVAVVAPIATLGRRTLRLTQIVGGAASVVAVALAFYAVSGVNNFSNLDLTFDSKNLLTLVGLALLGFAFIVVVGGTSGADFADSLTRAARGRSVFGWVALSMLVIPSIVFGFALAIIKSTSLMLYANWVASFNQRWILLALVILLLITLLSVLAANLYSLRKAVSGMRIGWSNLVIVIALGAALVIAVSFITQGISIAADVTLAATTWLIPLLVVVLAWAGILVSDILLRRIAYHEVSLNRAYGFYKAFNWVNILGLVLAVTLGLGLIKPTWGYGIDYFGYLLPVIGTVESAGAMQLGLIVAFFVGAVWPVAFGIPRIKQQEVEILATESRRDELKDVFGVADF